MNDVYQIVTLVFSVVAIVISVLSWRRSFEATRHDMADRYLLELQRLEFEHPDLRDIEWCQAALRHHEGKVRLQYDAFANMAWNYAETLYEQYGEKGLRESAFAGVVRNIKMRHRPWLTKNHQSYRPSFVRFIDELS